MSIARVSKLPEALNRTGHNPYFWHGERFTLWWRDEEGAWLLRNTDSTTIGRLIPEVDGTFRFAGNKGVPDMTHEHWQPIAMFASAAWLSS